MASSIIYPEDLVFPVDSTGAYSAGSATFSTQVSMASSFVSRPRMTRDFLNYSLICNYMAGSTAPKGTLSLQVTNASFDVSGSGQLTFRGPVDWVLKDASSISVGGNNADGSLVTPPFDLSVGLNSWGAVQLVYTSTSGSGTFYGKIVGIGG